MKGQNTDMGIKVSDLDKRADLFRLPTREDGTMVWVVVRREPRTKQGLPPAWWIQGIATDEKQAIAMCRHERYFIGPLPLNMALPEETIEWVGAYCPLAETVKKRLVKKVRKSSIT